MLFDLFSTQDNQWWTWLMSFNWFMTLSESVFLSTHHFHWTQCRCVDLRTGAFDVPPQEILTRDSVTVSVDAVVYYQVSNTRAYLMVDTMYHNKEEVELWKKIFYLNYFDYFKYNNSWTQTIFRKFLCNICHCNFNY